MKRAPPSSSSPLPPTPEVSTGAPAAEWRETTWLRAWEGNPRVGHDVEGIARSIRRLGFGAPILARPDGEVIAGHGRLAAARLLGLSHVPVRVMADLDDDEAHALALADNAYTDASHNDAALYAAAIKGLDEELARVLALPEPHKPPEERDDDTQTRLDASLRYEVVVACDDESHQAIVLADLESRGLRCRLLIL